MELMGSRDEANRRGEREGGVARVATGKSKSRRRTEISKGRYFMEGRGRTGV